MQWALAYLAGAWLLAEVTGHLSDTWDLPGLVVRGLHVVLACGFVLTLVLAWYHGEPRRQREGSGLTPAEFAAQVGVAHLLTGSVQRDGTRIRITVRLVEARSGEQLWTRVYEREGVIEAIDVQVDIARQVADHLAAEFSEREQDRLTAGMTDDPLGYDAYLHATRYDRTVPEELDLGIERLRYALRQDSTYAAAWAYLGGSYDWKQRTTGEEHWRDSTLQAFRRAAAHAQGTASGCWRWKERSTKRPRRGWRPSR